MNSIRDLTLNISDRYAEDLEWDYDAQFNQDISKMERLYGLANRLLHSTFYKVFYSFLAIISIVCLCLTLFQDCPTGFYIFMEVVINLALIVEVAVRIVAQGRSYFRYFANLLDLFLVIFCIVTLGILGRDCSGTRQLEKAIDTGLLVLRNTVQFVRLFFMLKRNDSARMTPSETNRNFFMSFDEESNNDLFHEDMNDIV